jgi:hypothetical protein
LAKNAENCDHNIDPRSPWFPDAKKLAGNVSGALNDTIFSAVVIFIELAPPPALNKVKKQYPGFELQELIKMLIWNRDSV